jgi:ubiquinone/menaquinone biosynthesis C-methylase UbiE
MNLNQLENFWDNIGETDPMWAILSTPQKRGNKWDEEEFFKTGKIEVDKLFSGLLTNIELIKEAPALDFGCGIGRCTRRLADYFNNATGVDISSSMIQKAKQINENFSNCNFIHNSNDTLKIFENESFGFIFSILTLQHIPLALQFKYIGEFCRILKKGGILIFQVVTSFSLNYRGILGLILGKKFLKLYNKKKYKLNAPIEMHLLKKSSIVKLMNDNNMTIVRNINDHSAGKSYVSYKFVCKKN